MKVLEQVANREARRVDIELDDVAEHMGEEMAEKVRRNTLRYKEIIACAIDNVLPAPTAAAADRDVFDVLMEERTRAAAAAASDAVGGVDPNNKVPAELTRRYQVFVLPRVKDKSVPLRQVKAKHIGSLLTLKGIVTRVTEVKPQMKVATYTCEQDGTETRGSKFEKFQEVKIQEEPDQVPQGHVPRAMTVHLYGDMTRQCAAGDTLTISGVFLPAGLITNTFLEAMSVEKHKKSSEELDELAEEPEVYSKLAQSIAPEIFGHDDVKKALLLLMVGGATRKMSDGMRIRGDVNICLMGDPGVAKSQLLKYIANTAPRAVYTTGKGSSGVGLTAAVVRDTVTGDLVLEGGALVLADMGICCIDEFDKMEEGDRTAIHEVMEQQTVSIAKAGITTTLNARTSVLAAANPAFSRYNTNRSVEENINLPAALLSRFDLLWLILDRPSHANDKRLAEHVTYVHRFSTHPALEFDPVSPQLMRAYIADITKIEPSVPPELAAYVVDEYVAMRQDAAENVENGYGFTSARTLLAILRLSQALARLRRSGTVSRDDVVEARRLMSLSKSSVLQVGDDDRDKAKQRGDAVSQVYRIIREHCDKSKAPAVAIAEILPKVLSRGLTQEALDECLREYAELDVWQLAGNGTIIRFVDAGDDDDA
ncbi:hypothetical protein EMIHUDRAFT_316205 [Emiliania huxleyi CCMP1516]|uniref:DNA replication licensing factor MCM7 n=2 Tax=Emiliania huxleyi TaxID=2903 RepID=A0A0D3IYI2_EMIH1|nr:hypothetical protein EMIHUDRAFT_310913 [Emiliania huxleyi CCMP1516]XP_005771554.1 hypothetical protein EMIHUDRAFT_316205 [Emiliania huxleyi CCMP1516]EOD16317.1 hypothetical protein EMIHUDRAFT_310913 [Emiliania huxleyi CCMP1516]EOD19125.1 hypothetical protein EMIHUDRAFT_316205 [Emiliania huxleyi CCMP1516]|eukprot:XP_005768746.1 hypothetical protein EMIHUDRAFT_310913 [Emiliania huxleyi CCMP1516]